MNSLGQIIEHVLRRNQMWLQYRQNSILERWEELVGKELAAVSNPRQIRKGVLQVSVKNSTWAYHLTLLQPQLIERLNRHAGSLAVKEIFFRIGDLKIQDRVDEDTEDNENLTDTFSPGSSFLKEIRELKNIVL
ncbi:MAG: DUF721 domain-containing protein [Bacillota bacterium]